MEFKPGFDLASILIQEKTINASEAISKLQILDGIFYHPRISCELNFVSVADRNDSHEFADRNNILNFGLGEK